MNWFQEWPCKCNRGDRVWHAHYPQYSEHSCARGCGCQSYEADIPERAAIRILLGPEVTPDMNAQAADILLGAVPPPVPPDQDAPAPSIGTEPVWRCRKCAAVLYTAEPSYWHTFDHKHEWERAVPSSPSPGQP